MHPACCPEPFPFACAQREPFLSGQRTPFTRPLVKQGQMHPSKFPPVMQVRAKEEDKAEPHLIHPARRRSDLEAVGGPPPEEKVLGLSSGHHPVPKTPPPG